MQKFISILLAVVLLSTCCLPARVIALSANDEYAGNHFSRMNEPSLLPYMEDMIYANLVQELDSEQYFVEKVEAVYISKEYLDEVAYNSQANIYFGYTLADLDEQFQGKKYVFTLSDDGQTVVKEMEFLGEDVYNKVIRNVAIGTGVILVCVTVSVLTGGAAPAVSMIFAASAKTGATVALSSGVFSGVMAGAVTGFQTKDIDKALEAAALAGSEGFKWGAIGGAISGGVTEFSMLKGATLNGLTMNQAASLQKETKWPLDAIKNLHSLEEAEIYKKAGLEPIRLGKNYAFIRDIDWNQVDQKGRTNKMLVELGLSPVDANQRPYQLHHIGQKADSPLAILTESEHLSEDFKALHWAEEGKNVPNNIWLKQKKDFWTQFMNYSLKG